MPKDYDSPDDRTKAIKGVTLHPTDSTDVRRQKLSRIILDAMYQFLGLLDVDGNVVEINQAALDGAGICLDEVVGKPFWEARWWAISEETKNRVRQMVHEARTGKFVRCDIEIFGDQQGQRTIYVDFSLTPIKDDDGNIAFLLPEGRNISEKIAIESELTRKNSELELALQRLREIDGFKTKFFANVSHELRTPLTLILGPLDQMLKEAQFQGERDRSRLQTIKRNAQSLLQQVNDLLDLARIDSEQMPLVYVCADINALVRELAAGFASVAEDRSIAFFVDSPGELYADIDRAKFSRVVVNLLSNAFKFTPVGGRIVVRLASLSPERFLLSIHDTGPGVPEELKRRIFSRFEQAHDELSGQGSGLGLNIVKEFVELHHGTAVALDAPGGGAMFQVEMPVRAPSGAYVREASVVEAPTPLPSGIGREASAEPVYLRVQGHKVGFPDILVVEDNPDLRHFLFDVLSDDYNVTLASNGRTGMEAVLAQVPDLIITDLMMPEIDGADFIRNLRGNPRFSHLPVLVLSARGDDVLRETLLDEMVQDYLTKPFSPNELRARVRNLVSVKKTVDILQKELNSQASDICELTSSLVSSRKSLQEGLLALQVSDRRWQGFYQNTVVGIALADRQGRILKANPALLKMLGYDEQEAASISLIEITEASKRAMTRRNVSGLFDGKIDAYQIEKRYERKDGSFLWANVSVSLIPAMDREGPRVAVIVEDITSRKAAEAELANTQADLARVSRFTTMGELVASIAHELNQPLSAIRTNSQAALKWLEREPPEYGEVADALNRLNRDASLAGTVISRVRGFMRKGEPVRESCDVHSLIDDLMNLLGGRLQREDVQTEIFVADKLPPLFADSVQLQQVIMNLVLNAIEAMHDQRGGEKRIAIDIRQDGAGGAVFGISDNGPGVPESARQKMFDALFSTKSDGMGMGLAISRSIVENHGGKLRFEPVVPHGARFIFNIPGTQ